MQSYERSDNNNNSTTQQALVIGDAMVDTYIAVEPVGISDEAPIAVVDWCGIRRVLGGMMNVAVSLQTLGMNVHTIGLANENDKAGIWIRENAQKTGLNSTWFSDGDNRPTIEKARVVANNDLDYLARLDHEQIYPIDDKALLNRIITCIKQKITESDVVVISDYAKGFINKTLADAIIKYAGLANCPVIVDAKPVTCSLLTGADLFTPNIKEAREFIKLHQTENNNYNNQYVYDNSDSDINRLGTEISRILQGDILITRNREGMTLCSGSDTKTIPCAACKSVDNSNKNRNTILSTSGAGDVVLAIMAYAVTQNNINLYEYAELASEIVAKTIVRPGTCTVQPDDIAEYELLN